MWINSLPILAITFLLALSHIADAKPVTSYQAKVSIVQRLLQAEKKFCSAYLNGAKPTQSTTTILATSIATASQATQIITNTVTAAAIPVQTTIVVATSTDITSVTQFNTETDTSIISEIVATSTIPVTIVQSTTFQPTSTISITTIVSYPSTTKTATVTSVQLLAKRDMLPTPLLQSRGRIVKPKVIQSYADALITDACHVLLYGTFSKAPATTTQVTTSTYTPAPLLITAPPVTVPASSTPTNTIPSTSTVTSTLIIPLTTTTTITLTTAITSSQTSLITTIETSTLSATTVTETVTSTDRSATTTTVTVITVQTPVASGTGNIIVTNSEDPLNIGKYFKGDFPDGGLILSNTPTQYTLDSNTGYIGVKDLIFGSATPDYIEMFYIYTSSPTLYRNAESYGRLICQSSINLTCKTPKQVNNLYTCQGAGILIGNGKGRYAVNCKLIEVAFVKPII